MCVLVLSHGSRLLPQVHELIRGEGMPRRLVVLCSVNGEARSQILLHFLRKGGHEPLAYPLPDGSPTILNVKKAIDFSRRIGCEGFVGFGGGGILNITKVCGGGVGALEKGDVPFRAHPHGGDAWRRSCLCVCLSLCVLCSLCLSFSVMFARWWRQCLPMAALRPIT